MYECEAGYLTPRLLALSVLGQKLWGARGSLLLLGSLLDVDVPLMIPWLAMERQSCSC